MTRGGESCRDLLRTAGDARAGGDLVGEVEIQLAAGREVLEQRRRRFAQ